MGCRLEQRPAGSPLPLATDPQTAQLPVLADPGEDGRSHGGRGVGGRGSLSGVGAGINPVPWDQMG